MRRRSLWSKNSVSDYSESTWELLTGLKSPSLLLRNTPSDIEAMTLRALVLFLKADLSSAVTQTTGILKLDPDNQKAKALRSRLKDISQQKESADKASLQNRFDAAIVSWTNALLVS